MRATNAGSFSMIPRRIISIWLSESEELPPLIQKCLPTLDVPGYERVHITLENCFRGTKYIQECLEAKLWAKAADYLRIHYLNELGGIYTDSDCELIPGKNFDALLGNAMFVGREKNNYVSNAIIGAEAGHPILADYLRTVERNFIGSGDLIFGPGMLLFNEKIQFKPLGEVTIYPPHLFLPYDHQTGEMCRNEETILTHWFNKSWIV